MSTIKNASEFGRVAVLMGGWSAERAVSLQSGASVLAALRGVGVDAQGVDADRDVVQVLRQGRYDRVFIALHGRGGEDGVIQGALDLIGLPYTGSGVLGSALGMDKVRTKRIWRGAGLPTPAFMVVEGAADPAALVEQLGLPLMVKPAHEGSSLGMSKVTAVAALAAALDKARALDNVVLVERCIEGPEYTASIVGCDVLPLIRVETPRGFYDYEAKYAANDTRYHCPCGLAVEVEARLRALSLQAFDGVGASGWGRVDFMCDDDGDPWFIEVNTVPGMTDHSLVPMAARQAGMTFEDLVWRILETSLDSHPSGCAPRAALSPLTGEGELQERGLT